jgi:hypothetical protein
MANTTGLKRFSCFCIFWFGKMAEDKESISEPVSKRPRLLFRILGTLYQEDAKLPKPKLPNLFRPGSIFNPDGSKKEDEKSYKTTIQSSSSSSLSAASISVPILLTVVVAKRTCPMIQDMLVNGDLWQAAGIPRIVSTSQLGDTQIFNCESKEHCLIPVQLKNRGVLCSVERPST